MKKCSILIVLFIFLFSGCASLFPNPDNPDLQQALVKETVDTFGFTLGLFAAKDPVFKSQVEHYYTTVSEQGLTVVVVNEIMQKFKEQDIAYQILAYKMISMIKLFGGTLNSDGTIDTFGTIPAYYFEVGKNAYLMAIRTQQSSFLEEN